MYICFIFYCQNERNRPYFNLRISESHEDSHISKMSVNGDRYITDFDTFLAKETNSAKGTGYASYLKFRICCYQQKVIKWLNSILKYNNFLKIIFYFEITFELFLLNEK